MVISQGDICWADLPDSAGSAAGFRRPVVIVQGDAFNCSRIATVVVVPLTSNLRLAAAPGNVEIASASSGLPKETVANVSLVMAIDRALLEPRVGKLSESELGLVLAGIELVLGRG